MVSNKYTPKPSGVELELDIIAYESWDSRTVLPLLVGLHYVSGVGCPMAEVEVALIGMNPVSSLCLFLILQQASPGV